MKFIVNFVYFHKPEGPQRQDCDRLLDASYALGSINFYYQFRVGKLRGPKMLIY